MNRTLPKKFGVFHFNWMKAHLQQMLSSYKAELFDIAYESASQVIHNDQKWLQLFSEFQDCKEKYAQYLVTAYDLGLQRLGSPPVEQNHLNYLKQIGELSVAQPEEAICKTICHQKEIKTKKTLPSSNITSPWWKKRCVAASIIMSNPRIVLLWMVNIQMESHEIVLGEMTW